MADTLRWGILGTGRIAAALAEALLTSKTGELAAVGSRSQGSADAFAQRWAPGKQARRYDSYQGVLDDAEVDVVYIALPNQLHAEWACKCAAAGKHILCEKPIGLNAGEAQTSIDAAKQHDVFLMEAFMYRCHPQTAKVVEMIGDGAVGDVRLLQASFAFHMAPEWREKDPRMVNAWAGGGIMDVGCYTVSLSRLIAGVATGQRSPIEPTDITGVAHIDPENRVDLCAAATCRFDGDIIAALACGIMVDTDWTYRIYGSDGRIEIPNPWKPPATGAVIKRFDEGGDAPEVITIDAGRELYEIEVDTVAKHIADRQPPVPFANWDDTMQNMRTLDRWRDAIGLRWEGE